MPSSATTVSGVVCETKRLGGPPFFETAWLAFGWEPRPTPTSGWCANTFTVSSTRRERSLVTRWVDASRDLVGDERAAAGEHDHGRDRRDEPDGAVAGDDAR